VLNKLDPKN